MESSASSECERDRAGAGAAGARRAGSGARLRTSVNDSLSTGMGESALSAPAGPKSATASSRNGRAGGASDEEAPKPIRGFGGFAIGLRSLQGDLKGEVDVLALHLQRRPQRQLHRPLRGIARGFRQLDPNRLLRSGKRDEERVQPV